MYPKSTLSGVQKDHPPKNNRQIIPSDTLEYSHLSFTSDRSGLFQVVNIDMPYLIIYERFSKSENSAIYQEFSENNRVLIRRKYTDFEVAAQKMHLHNFYELTIVLSGELNLKIENEDIIYRAGDCCLCNKNIHHLESYHNDVEFALFLLQEEYVDEICKKNFFYDQSQPPAPLENIFDVFFRENKKNPFYDAKIYNDYRLKENENSLFIIEQINTMISEISSEQSGKSHMMKALFCRFFDLLQDGSLYREEIHQSRLSDAENLVYRISNAYRKKDGIFSRQEIEALTGYQGDYAERVFKKTTGMTLLAFGKRIVVQKAAHLLIHSDLSIGEICEKLGYSNRHYFNMIFQKEYGMTPSEYRKQQKDNLPE